MDADARPAGIGQKAHHLTGESCGESQVIGVDRAAALAALGADGVPGAAADGLVVVGAGRGDRRDVAIDAAAERGHYRSRVGGVPALPVAHGGPGRHAVLGVDDEGGGGPAVAIGVGVKRKLDRLVIGRGEDPGVGGRVGVGPVAVVHLEFIAAGGGDGEDAGVDAVVGYIVAVGTVVVHEVGAPAVEGATDVPGWAGGQGVGSGAGRKEEAGQE